jgi:aspartyl-tRNA synthetase
LCIIRSARLIPEDMQYFDSEPTKVRAQTYDLVMNGNEILSGSIRIHQKDLQDRVFAKLGLSKEEMDAKVWLYAQCL